MNCDCVEDIRTKMVDHFKPEAGNDVQAECGGLGINLRTGGMSLSIPWTIRSSARGFSSAKGKSTYMVASFCPFCGKSAAAEPVKPAEGK